MTTSMSLTLWQTITKRTVQWIPSVVLPTTALGLCLKQWALRQTEPIRALSSLLFPSVLFMPEISRPSNRSQRSQHYMSWRKNFFWHSLRSQNISYVYVLDRTESGLWWQLCTSEASDATAQHYWYCSGTTSFSWWPPIPSVEQLGRCVALIYSHPLSYYLLFYIFSSIDANVSLITEKE